MNVRELIEELKNFDPEMEVWVMAADEYARPLTPEEVWQGDHDPDVGAW